MKKIVNKKIWIVFIIAGAVFLSGILTAAASDDGYRSVFESKRQTGNPEEDAVIHSDLHGKTPEKKYTLMIYMIGSDLESRAGMASKDLLEMKEAGVDFNDTNLIVYTGGSEKWQSDIPSDRNCVIDLSQSEGDQIVGWTEHSADMGEAVTLSNFLNFCYESYPADHYALICWDHGSGPLYGYGYDKLFNSDSLLLSEMKEAMQNTPFGSESKLDWVGFDACLMAGIENANIWKDYADYLVGSEELEPGDGWDYAFLNVLNSTSDPERIAERIIQQYEVYYKENAGKLFDPDVTLSCLDLSQTNQMVETLDGLISVMKDDISADKYASLYSRRGETKAFGLAASGNRRKGYDILDLRDFLDNMKELYPEETAHVNQILDLFVIQSYSNMDHCGGVSFYFPGDNQELYREIGKEEYDKIAMSDTYRSFLTSYTEQWASAEDITWSFPELQECEDGFYLSLTPQQADNIYKISYTILKETKIGNYVPIMEEVQLHPDENLKVCLPLDPEVLVAVSDLNEEKPIVVSCIQMSASTELETYQSRNLSVFSGMWGSQNFNREISLNLQRETGRKELSVKTAMLQSESIDTGGKNTINLNDYRRIRCDYGIALKFDKTGEYEEILPYTSWEHETYKNGGTREYEEEIQFELVPCSKAGVSAIAQILIEDIHGNLYATEVKPLQQVLQKAQQTDSIQVRTSKGIWYFRENKDGMTAIGYRGSGSNLELPEKVNGAPVTEIRFTEMDPSMAFSSCEVFEMPDTVKRIGARTFADWKALKTVRFSRKLQTLGGHAFENCGNLIDIMLPASLEKIGAGVFDNCGKLKNIGMGRAGRSADSVTSRRAVRNYRSVDGVLFSEDLNNLIAFPNGRNGTYIVPEGTRKIEYGAFAYGNISKVELPDTLEEIDNCAFFDCCELEVPHFPESLRRIGGQAFSRILLMPHDVDEERIRRGVLYIGENLETIGDDAFGGIFFSKYEVSPDNHVFSEKEGFLTNKREDVLIAAPSQTSDVIDIPEGICGIEDMAFYYYGLKYSQITFNLPDSLIRAGEYALPFIIFKEKDDEQPIKIRCHEGTYAEKYAKKQGYLLEII